MIDIQTKILLSIGVILKWILRICLFRGKFQSITGWQGRDRVEKIEKLGSLHLWMTPNWNSLIKKVIFTQKDLLLQKYHVLYIIDYFFLCVMTFWKKKKNICDRIQCYSIEIQQSPFYVVNIVTLNGKTLYVKNLFYPLNWQYMC